MLSATQFLLHSQASKQIATLEKLLQKGQKAKAEEAGLAVGSQPVAKTALRKLPLGKLLILLGLTLVQICTKVLLPRLSPFTRFA